MSGPLLYCRRAIFLAALMIVVLRNMRYYDIFISSTAPWTWDNYRITCEKWSVVLVMVWCLWNLSDDVEVLRDCKKRLN